MLVTATIAYLDQAKLKFGFLVEHVVCVLKVLGITVTDLTLHFPYLYCQTVKLILYLEITETLQKVKYKCSVDDSSSKL